MVIAVLFSSWRAQAAACAVLNGAVLLMWPLLPESGRWLLCQGRKEEAVKVRHGGRAADCRVCHSLLRFHWVDEAYPPRVWLLCQL